MTNTHDLHIEDEILPLFDATFNLYSGQALRAILTTPLSSPTAIRERQLLLQGFIANHVILKDYSFSRFNLAEIYDFFSSFNTGSISGAGLARRLMFNEKERHSKRGKLILLILLFHKIHSSFTSRLDTKHLPTAYAAELDQLNEFFSDFNLAHYEAILRKKNKISVSDIVALLTIISEKTTNGQIAAFWERWFLFEAYLSISQAIIKQGFTFPEFSDAPFTAEGIYHPFLKNPVKNNIKVSSNVILLTGPNMSGKSTFLKAVGICIYLGHCGLAVPASKSSMPFFDALSVAINLTDSIVSGYSHFMSEIITLKNVLTEAKNNKKCFAVFDELFRGTNIEDAIEISTATIRGLTNFPQSLFFISTHLHQLKDMEEITDNKVASWYIDCILQNNTPAFTYKLKEGWSDLKIGRILFEKEGLNEMLTR